MDSGRYDAMTSLAGPRVEVPRHIWACYCSVFHCSGILHVDLWFHPLAICKQCICILKRNTTCHGRWLVGKLLWHGAILMRWLWRHENALKTCQGCSIWTSGIKKEICKSITWQHFTTLYFKDGFLIKSRTTQPYGQTLVTFVPLLLKVLWWTVGMPGLEKRGWLEVLAVTCAKLTGCLCSHFTVIWWCLFLFHSPGSFSAD